MRRKLLLLSALSIAGAIALACSGGQESGGSAGGTSVQGELRYGLTAEQAAQVLAKVGDREITVGEFADKIASKGPFLRARYNSPERRRELLDQMIRFELLAQEAEREGFYDLPEVQRARKQVLIRRFLKTQYEDRIRLEDISDEDVRAYYEAHRDEFNKPEQVRASHILIRSRQTAERVLRQILDNPTDIRLFRELAERHNEDPETRDRFGDLRFFSRPEERQADEPEVPAEVARAAFSIPSIGGVHPELVQSERGYHIVKLTGRRAALHRSLEEAARPIRHRLWRERREQAVEELVQRLRAEADVEEDLSLLSEIRIPESDGTFPTERAAPAVSALREQSGSRSDGTLVPAGSARTGGARGAAESAAGRESAPRGGTAPRDRPR
jgi:peptidyl-prolyl cis-trans isomerase C